jgi:hypothetical protein
MTPGKTRTALAAALSATLLACAAAEPPPPGPSPFRAAKKLVLVRRVDDPRAPRARDPIDALKESLEARGYEARIVEVGAAEDPSLRDLERLEDRIAGRYWNRGEATTRGEKLGAEAGAVVAKLGADAVAGWHRLDNRMLPLPPPPDPFASPYAAQRGMASARRPSGALSLVAADGSVAWFPWGGAGADLDARALLNPAEAIDALLAALSGGTGDDG